MINKILFLLLLMGCLAGSASLLAQQNATDDLIKSLQARVKRYPEDYAGYAGLGAAYLQRGRETADAADDQVTHPVGMLQRHLQREPRAHRVAHEIDPPELEVVH